MKYEHYMSFLTRFTMTLIVIVNIIYLPMYVPKLEISNYCLLIIMGAIYYNAYITKQKNRYINHKIDRYYGKHNNNIN